MKTYDWIYAGLIAVAVLYLGAWWLDRRARNQGSGRLSLDEEAYLSQCTLDEIEAVAQRIAARRYGLRHDATDQWVVRRQVMGRWQFELVEHCVEWWPLGEAIMHRRDAEYALGPIALEPLPTDTGEPGAN